MTPTIPRNSFWIDHGKFCFTQFIICCAMLIPIRLQDLHFFPRFPPGAFRSHAAFRRYGPYPWHWPWGSLAAHPSSPQTIPLLKYFEFGLKKESFKWIWGCIQMDLVYRPRNQTKKNGCKTIHMPRPIILQQGGQVAKDRVQKRMNERRPPPNLAHGCRCTHNAVHAHGHRIWQFLIVEKNNMFIMIVIVPYQ